MATDKVRLASIGLGWWGGVLVDAVNRSGSGEVVTGFAPEWGCPQGVFRETRLPHGGESG